MDDGFQLGGTMQVATSNHGGHDRLARVRFGSMFTLTDLRDRQSECPLLKMFHVQIQWTLIGTSGAVPAGGRIDSTVHNNSRSRTCLAVDRIRL